MIVVWRIIYLFNHIWKVYPPGKIVDIFIGNYEIRDLYQSLNRFGTNPAMKLIPSISQRLKKNTTASV